MINIQKGKQVISQISFDQMVSHHIDSNNMNTIIISN